MIPAIPHMRGSLARPADARERCTASHRPARSFRVQPGARDPWPTPADQRLLELLEKWLKSLELHVKYARLDSDSYWKIQPWPEHQRPSRWIIDLAAQKAVALKARSKSASSMGDTKFSDSLELMTFLANLIGSEHIERFIPLAEAGNERELERSARASRARGRGRDARADAGTPATRTPDAAPRAARETRRAAARSAPARPASTREMPKFAAAKRPRRTAAPGAPRTAAPPRGKCRSSPPRSGARRRP